MSLFSAHNWLLNDDTLSKSDMTSILWIHRYIISLYWSSSSMLAVIYIYLKKKNIFKKIILGSSLSSLDNRRINLFNYFLIHERYYTCL